MLDKPRFSRLPAKQGIDSRIKQSKSLNAIRNARLLKPSHQNGTRNTTLVVSFLVRADKNKVLVLRKRSARNGHWKGRGRGGERSAG